MKHKSTSVGKLDDASEMIEVSLGNVKNLIQGLNQLINYMKKGCNEEKLYAACHADFICKMIQDDADIPRKMYNELVSDINNGFIKPLPSEPNKTKH